MVIAGRGKRVNIIISISLKNWNKLTLMEKEGWESIRQKQEKMKV